ncbi:MAG: hydroxyacid dehydrogenase [Legionellales bacterium]|nr:hydroxyacid dehydrogenase [Legionellales bacterium]
MKIILFNSKTYDKTYFENANSAYQYDIFYQEAPLTASTAKLAKGFEVVCAFVNDSLDAATIKELADEGGRLIALRCAGFNHVDLGACQKYNLTVVRVPAYSPYAVAEHTMALILALNRKIHKAYHRVREANFSLEGLLGFDMHGTSVGVIGLGKIGLCFVKIAVGFGCDIKVYDPFIKENPIPDKIKLVDLETLCKDSKIISMHCPLTKNTQHIINKKTLEFMQDGVMLINTGRGALVDTQAVINGLKSGKVGALGLDVYEEEKKLFFEDQSEKILQDDIFARLLTFPNVIITGHQGFFTENALDNIAKTTLANIKAFVQGKPVNLVS